MNDDWDSLDWEMNDASPLADSETFVPASEVPPYFGGTLDESGLSRLGAGALHSKNRDRLEAECNAVKALRAVDPERFSERANELLLKAAEVGASKVCVDLIDAGADPNATMYPFEENAASLAFNSNQLTTSLILVCLGSKLSSAIDLDIVNADLKQAFVAAEKFASIVKRK